MRYSLSFALFFAVCAVSSALAQEILINEVGYEQNGPKRAVIQSSTAITDTKASLVNSSGTMVQEITLGSQTSVSGWSGRNFKIADFSSFEQAGTYKLKVGSRESQSFKIGKKILQTETGADQVNFFNKMRNTDAGDRNLGIYNSSQTQNIYGGWWDATGDPGKHISHLSYANYFNPQQIPLVVWSLLHANELQPSTFGASTKDEAAWGADYLLRSLSTAGYFYMSVFDSWGAGHREICAWSGEGGTRSAAYQSAMREGGGVSIAALARASKAGISKDSSSAQYLAGAKRAYAHLKANPTTYQDDGIENIIDDYAGLLAATELYNATQEATYKTDADTRAQSLLSRQSDEGWFYTVKKSGANTRPFYHAADEGLPIVALARYVEICNPASAIKNNVQSAIKKNLQWYAKITSEISNPFEYVKMYGDASSGVNPGETNLALGGTATASRSEGSYTPGKAIDGSTAGDSRWSSYQSGAENNNQWIAIDLGSTYKVNKVVLNWEAAYGKSYRIEVSDNGTSWTQVINITNNTSAGPKTHTFTTPTTTRHVRMYGVERGNEYGGFSLYEFEIYGEPSGQQPATPHNARFFMPHNNETGYWWQGENARIASLSAAFTMGAQLADPSGKFWTDTLFGMASAQLDWILGKNPFGVSMMFGFGAKNYPNYPASRGLANIKGGICNGITAKDGNENNLDWKPYGDGEWQNWRWIEQWLPHNAWYLIAISSLSNRIDNPIIPPPVDPGTDPEPEPGTDPEPPEAIKSSNPANIPGFNIVAVNTRNITMKLPFASRNSVVSIYNIHGQKLVSYSIPAGNLSATVELPSNMKSGIYLLKLNGTAKKFVY
ncbi:MAG: discoidin domain-containing protein [Fibromonadaceae bacterium]|jgi:hypothetical protein|nr:discoidin domain-containing protein [Fibromonadaceae bacterium]